MTLTAFAFPDTDLLVKVLKRSLCEYNSSLSAVKGVSGTRAGGAGASVQLTSGLLPPSFTPQTDLRVRTRSEREMWDGVWESVGSILGGVARCERAPDVYGSF